jgi:hypothetical protein
MTATASMLLILCLCLAAILLVWKLFWPHRSSALDANDPWAQHNEQRTPSLESAPAAGATEVDAAVAAEMTGSPNA